MPVNSVLQIDASASRGFTRPELLGALVVAVLLASIAIALLQTLEIREQIQRALDDTLPVRHAVARHILDLGDVPVDETAAGLDPGAGESTSEFLQNARVSNGRIQMIFGNHAHQRIALSRLDLEPYLDEAGNLDWRCGNGPEPAGKPLAPGARESASSIPEYYLPAKCRP